MKAPRLRWWSAALAAAAAVAVYAAWGRPGGPDRRPRRPSDRGPSSWSFGRQLPGATPYGPLLVKALDRRWAARPAGTVPRTRHLRADGSPKYTNRLLLESSPYLLQHAHNPVDFYPWGDEAFEVARRLGRPVLLSVGYSTCHWCHVMEEESFDDEEIAGYLNAHYVAIKVDREERPDVDAVYMAAVQSMTGRGGWPMTVWLTPDRKPFYGATYIPARDGDRGSRVGFLTILARLRSSWDGERGELVATAEETTRAIERQLQPRSGRGLPSADVVDAAVAALARRFDGAYGGTGRAPKFPSSLPVRLLLRHHRRTKNEDSLRMATLTLERMAAGGMYDQIAGGFHRYSTDREWLVPHFEKMLYDNALLAVAYLEAHQATGRARFASVAREILRYIDRDMTSPEGAFYSATDADSLGPDGRREEGWFFTWTPETLDAVLGAAESRLVKAYYAVTPGGNFEGRTILHTPRPPAEVAREIDLPEDRAWKTLGEAREVLYRARALRPAPLRDEKILAAWNGLTISALAKASLALGDRAYADRAERAAGFVLDRMQEGGRLLRSYKDGEARHPAYLEDYAFLVAGLLDLYEATSRLRWLDEAVRLDVVLERHYEDRAGGGFYTTSDDHERLLAREKPGYDGAEPSGNSVHALNLLRLHELTSDDRYRQRAEGTLAAFGRVLGSSPTALSEMLLALEFLAGVPKEIVIVTRGPRADAEPFLARLRGVFLPSRVLVVVSEGAELEAHLRLAPLLEGKVARGGDTTAYVCERSICELPTTDPAVFASQLARPGPRSSRER